MGLHKTTKFSDLIYDVGMHTGEDTEYFLKKGFRVVAFEADPDLIQLCEEKFQSFIAEGKLIVVKGAIVSRDHIRSGADHVVFYKNRDVSVWGTIHSSWAERNRNHNTSSVEVRVGVVDFSETLQKYGVPHYLKVDIEGADMICVDSLRDFENKPDFISIESDKTSLEAIRHELSVLSQLGYTGFKAIEQSGLHLIQRPPKPAREGIYVDHQFVAGASGLFGDELPGKWLGLKSIRRKYTVINLGYYLVSERGILPKRYFPLKWQLRALICRILSLFTKAPVPGWYDTHARHSSAASFVDGRAD